MLLRWLIRVLIKNGFLVNMIWWKEIFLSETRGWRDGENMFMTMKEASRWNAMNCSTYGLNAKRGARSLNNNCVTYSWKIKVAKRLGKRRLKLSRYDIYNFFNILLHLYLFVTTILLAKLFMYISLTRYLYF